ncbi:hypothetical protein B0H13DRAFT_2301128 [Mycena leptocephala]|nr:hypothetical protein B0H13DRAFT_2301128 [Mycena leptocephala]
MANATSNDTQAEYLGTSDSTSLSTPNRVQFFAHTLNLSVKALLKLFTESMDDDAPTTSSPVLPEDDDDDDLPELVSASEESESDGDDEGEEDVLSKLDGDDLQTLLTDT